MQFVCDADGQKTWFRIETEAEAAQESQLMSHAVEKHFRRAHEEAAQSYRRELCAASTLSRASCSSSSGSSSIAPSSGRAAGGCGRGFPTAPGAGERGRRDHAQAEAPPHPAPRPPD